MQPNIEIITYPPSTDVCLWADERDFFRYLEIRKALEQKERELLPLKKELIAIAKKYEQPTEH